VFAHNCGVHLRVLILLAEEIEREEIFLEKVTGAYKKKEAE